MLVIREENNSFKFGHGELRNLKKMQSAGSFQTERCHTSLNEDVMLNFRPVISEAALYKIEQNEDAKVARLAKSMVRMAEAALYKIEQNEDAKVARLAEEAIGKFENTMNYMYVS